MLSNDLFHQILIAPAKSGANFLYIVSGYASPAAVAGHLAYVPSAVKIKLIVGMTGKDGLLKAHHQAFVRIQQETYPGQFECYYVVDGPPVHTKLYVWFINNLPFKAFTGSANYTNFGMKSNREVLEVTNPAEGYQYFSNLLKSAVPCTDPRIPKLIPLHSIPDRLNKPILAVEHPEILLPKGSHKSVEISFLDRSNNLPARSGLNWGKRPEYNRNPNQAYIRVPSTVAQSDFFPPRGTYFTIVTDDGKTFDGVVAQANNKAVETPRDNSLLGKYFRERLGLPDGAEVKKYHLLNYGRTTVKFVKIDADTYYMDFSVPTK